MDNKMICVLAGYDDATEARLSGIQKDLYAAGFSGVQTKDIPMHFTLGSYDTEREEELKERLTMLADTFPAFYVAFNHVGLFRLPQNDVLFVAPEVSKEMLALKDHFLDNKPDVIAEALKQVMQDFPAMEGKVNTIYLYEFWPTRHILTVHLKET